MGVVFIDLSVLFVRDQEILDIIHLANPLVSTDLDILLFDCIDAPFWFCQITSQKLHFNICTLFYSVYYLQ
ncbi:unnamed protein product [Trichobilharzia szidati]|nr:unnamed protein product [Trichobilharzia szidati]